MADLDRNMVFQPSQLDQLRAASVKLGTLLPLKPERLRNGQVSRPGFGDFPISQITMQPR